MWLNGCGCVGEGREGWLAKVGLKKRVALGGTLPEMTGRENTMPNPFGCIDDKFMKTKVLLRLFLLLALWR
jgi:hypothetical protein